MKIGMRTPSPKKRVKARTTGRVKRAAKASVNPLYGKKGMGKYNDPKKKIYNKVYNKTTVDIFDSSSAFDNRAPVNNVSPTGVKIGCFMMLLAPLGIALVFLTKMFWIPLFMVVAGITGWIIMKMSMGLE